MQQQALADTTGAALRVLSPWVSIRGATPVAEAARPTFESAARHSQTESSLQEVVAVWVSVSDPVEPADKRVAMAGRTPPPVHSEETVQLELPGVRGEMGPREPLIRA